jgi:hypothetical protein
LNSCSADDDSNQRGLSEGGFESREYPNAREREERIEEATVDEWRGKLLAMAERYRSVSKCSVTV